MHVGGVPYPSDRVAMVRSEMLRPGSISPHETAARSGNLSRSRVKHYVYTDADVRRWIRMLRRQVRRARFETLVEYGQLDLGEAGA
jgi:hypothetical protein